MTTAWRKATFSSDNAHCVKIRFDGPRRAPGRTPRNAHLGDLEPTPPASPPTTGAVPSPELSTVVHPVARKK